MNHSQAVIAAQKCDSLIVEIYGHVPPEQSDKGVRLSHLRWMVRQIPTLSENKAMRWLGYIQGILVGHYGFKLSDMKEISMKAVQE